MAKYTTELRSICEVYAGYSEGQGYSDIDTVIDNARAKLFDFDYPIFDTDYKATLETKIIKHFYTREICAETVGRWKLFLNERMNLIMPYYNKLYSSELLDFNPFYDIDLTRDHDKGNEGNTSSTRKDTGTDALTRGSKTATTSADTADDWQYYSDTPQGDVTGITNKTYLTNATNNTANDSTTSETNTSGTDTTNSTTDSTGTSEYKDTESYLEHVKGKAGGASYSELLEQYRKTFINIDQRVINDLNDLFINLW